MRTNQVTTGQAKPVLFHAVACKACGAEWPSDPALQVACTECKARPGELCRWDRPHGYGFHRCRDQLAMHEGYLSACEALTWDGRHSRHAVAVLPSASLALF